MINFRNVAEAFGCTTTGSGTLDYIICLTSSEPMGGDVMDTPITSSGQIVGAVTSQTLVGNEATYSLYHRSIREMYFTNISGSNAKIKFGFRDRDGNERQISPEFTIQLNETLAYRDGTYSIIKANDPDAETFREFQTKLFNILDEQLGDILSAVRINNLHQEQITGCEFTEENLE